MSDFSKEIDEKDLDLYKGIEYCNPRKLVIKVKDDLILECLFKWNSNVKYISATKDIFNSIKYFFENKKDYLKFKELYDLELVSENMKIKHKAGWYDQFFDENGKYKPFE